MNEPKEINFDPSPIKLPVWKALIMERDHLNVKIVRNLQNSEISEK